MQEMLQTPQLCLRPQSTAAVPHQRSSTCQSHLAPRHPAAPSPGPSSHQPWLFSTLLSPVETTATFNLEGAQAWSVPGEASCGNTVEIGRKSRNILLIITSLPRLVKLGLCLLDFLGVDRDSGKLSDAINELRTP